MLTTVAAGRVFDFSHCIGMYGMAGQGFWTPQDFVLGSEGLVYVLNRGAEELGQRVTRCTLDHHFSASSGVLARVTASSSGPVQSTWTGKAACTPPTKGSTASPCSTKRAPFYPSGEHRAAATES